ncbi:methionyl-tRNA formyltransferase [Mycoplasmatota bacterium]|nr:methionyl-tRNA formyltransferase [Mycoplasmatota bacterium]
MKIVFMGTPDFSVDILQKLIDNFNVNLVVTQPDKKVGRKREIRFSPIKELAIENNLKVFQPVKIKDDYQTILNEKPDLIVTAAYGQFIPEEVLNYPKYGSINVHASLLPKFRGGSPIHRAITTGEEYTGVTIMYMVRKMDAGDILSQIKVKIEENDTCASMHDKLSKVGAKLIISTILDLVNGKITPLSQDESKVTYAYNITRDEEKINWNLTSQEIHNHIRGFDSWPGTFTKLNNLIIKIYPGEIINCRSGTPGEIINIDKDGILVRTSDGGYLLKEIQIQGKKRIKISDFINGNKVFYSGDIFS